MTYRAADRIAEYAAMVGVHRETARRWALDGTVPSVTVGGIRFIPAAWVAEVYDVGHEEPQRRDDLPPNRQPPLRRRRDDGEREAGDALLPTGRRRHGMSRDFEREHNHLPDSCVVVDYQEAGHRRKLVIACRHGESPL